MYQDELKSKLKRIFGLRKTTFDAPSESFEQDTLFVEISESYSRMTKNTQTSRVNGVLVVYSQGDKLPYGFFNKKIEQADAVLTKDFFFYGFDQNPANSPARTMNIYERRVNFVYLYSAQYDPDQGELTEVDFGG